MKKITLNASGISITTAFTTVVSKIINPDKDSRIVLDSMPNVEISLGEASATSLELIKGSTVTIEPVKGSDDNSFTLTVGKPMTNTVASSAAPTRGSSPAYGATLSNDID